MQAILAVTIPFFALVLLGYLAAWRRLLPESAIPGLNIYVLYFALPCLLFRFGSSLPLARVLNPALIGVYALCALVVVALSIGITWRRHPDAHGVDLRDAAFGAFVAAFPNSGFMGLPLLVGLLGERAAGPVISAMLVDLFLTSTLCLALAQAHVQRAGDAARRAGEADGDGGETPDATTTPLLISVARSLRGAMTNPQPWSIAVGITAGALGLALPAPVAQIVKMLGDSATPVALFTIGTVLWRAGQHAHTRTPLDQYLPLAIVKLLLHPLLVLAVAALARAGGVEISNFALVVLVLVAALPSASGVSLLAERFGADNGRVARIIMASTVLAFASFTVIAWALGAQAQQ